jgi:hypothetical protein
MIFRSALFSLAVAMAPLALAQEFKLDAPVGQLGLTDPSGAVVNLPAAGSPATVVIFISTQCPVSNGYNSRMMALHRDYSPKGVRFLFVNANRTEDAAAVAEHARKIGFAFPVYKDPDNVLADRFNAQVTPETYVIDPAGILRYHGAIDDSPANESRVTARPLRAALDALLAGGVVARKEAKAMGCTIKRVARKPS